MTIDGVHSSGGGGIDRVPLSVVDATRLAVVELAAAAPVYRSSDARAGKSEELRTMMACA
jgi:hypothetical protein